MNQVNAWRFINILRWKNNTTTGWTACKTKRTVKFVGRLYFVAHTSYFYITRNAAAPNPFISWVTSQTEELFGSTLVPLWCYSWTRGTTVDLNGKRSCSVKMPFNTITRRHVLVVYIVRVLLLPRAFIMYYCHWVLESIYVF